MVIAEEGVVRLTASVSQSQEQALKELAANYKVSVAWFINCAIDRLMGQDRKAQLPFELRR